MESDGGQIRLESIQRRGRLYLLIFSNDYEVRASGRVIDQTGLAEGAKFTEQTFDELRRILEWEFARYTAESMLARRPYSVGEFKRGLRQKGISDEHIKRIVGDFREKELLDDYQYALARARSLHERRPAGRGYLISWLRKRLVPREIAEQAVAELLGDVDEVDTAVELLERKKGSLSKFDLETARKKAYTYLSRRAISYGAAKAAFEKVFESSD